MNDEWVWDEILIGSEKSTDFTLRMTGMIQEWWKTFKTRRSDASELAFSKSQSTQPPLQRGLGGLTSRLEWQEWFMDDGMMLKWREWVLDELIP